MFLQPQRNEYVNIAAVIGLMKVMLIEKKPKNEITMEPAQRIINPNDLAELLLELYSTKLKE